MNMSSGIGVYSVLTLSPLGIIVGGSVATAIAVQNSTASMDPAAIGALAVLGIGATVLGAAVPLTIKLTRLQTSIHETLGRLAENISGNKEIIAGHERTLYGEKDDPEKGLVRKTAHHATQLDGIRASVDEATRIRDDLRARLAEAGVERDRLRVKLVEAEKDRDRIKGDLAAVNLVLNEQERRLKGDEGLA